MFETKSPAFNFTSCTSLTSNKIGFFFKVTKNKLRNFYSVQWLHSYILRMSKWLRRSLALLKITQNCSILYFLGKVKSCKKWVCLQKNSVSKNKTNIVFRIILNQLIQWGSGLAQQKERFIVYNVKKMCVGGAKIDLTHIVFAAGKNVKMLPKLRGGWGRGRGGVALFDISIWHIECRYIDTFEKYRYRYQYRYGHIWKYRYRYRYR